MANTVLAKMAVQISANTAEFSKALNKTNKDLNSFASGVKNIAGTIGIAFGIQQVGAFALEITKLAGEADGVRRAFNKFPQSVKLMDSLKDATSQTVSELDLMKRTVQATNFGISLGALPKLLEFASVRAQQTGQSVDYLVDSIVTGIGRKSPLILDNLGISAVALKEKLDGISVAEASVGQVADAVGKIAEESLKKMGSMADTTAVKMQALGASWTNLKVTLGELIEPFATFSVKFVTDFIDLLRGVKPPILELALAMDDFNKSQPHGKDFLDAYGELEKVAERAGKKLVLLTDSATGLRKVMIDPRTPMSKPIADIIPPAKTLDDILKSIQDRYDKLNSLSRKAFEAPIDATRQQPSMMGVLVDPAAITAQVQAAIKTLQVLPVEFRAVQEEMIDISGLIVGGIVDIASAFGEAAVTGGRDFGRTFLAALGRFAQQFGGLLISIGIGEKALKFGGPGAKIAAGVALVALGGAISALMANKPSLSGGGSGSGGGRFQSPQYAGSLNFANGSRSGGIVLEARGTSLVGVYDAQTSRNGRLRPNTRRLG